ncbi:MAG: hypothetical protein R6U35_06765 [Candidatus Humimicrobiaceae bacterium]
MIEVRKKNGNHFTVKVQEGSSSKNYSVTLDDDYYRKLTGKKATKEELIKKSFEFLLEREPKESILSSFNLKVISNYFPEYEKKIKEY